MAGRESERELGVPPGGYLWDCKYRSNPGYWPAGGLLKEAFTLTKVKSGSDGTCL